MKGTIMESGCCKREQLMAYSTRLLEPEEEAQIRRHLASCTACRAVADEYGALDAVLDEWKPAEPSPWFDARLRAAVASAAAARQAHRGLFGLAWTAWSAPLVMAALVAVSVIIIRTHRPGLTPVADSHSSGAVSGADRANPPASTTVEPSDRTQANDVNGAGSPDQAAVEPGAPSSSYAARVAEDDDMLTNFEVLSELPAAPDDPETSN